MTITYHAGRRIQGLSTDILQTADLTDDFTSNTMTINGSTITYDATNDEYDLAGTTGSSTAKNATLDLIGGVIDSNNWLLRTHVDIDSVTGYSTGGAAHANFIGLSDATNRPLGDSTGQQVGFYFTTNPTQYNAWCSNNGFGSPQGETTGKFTHTPTTESLYIEISRNNNTITVSLYSDSNYSTLIESKTTGGSTVDSSLNALRYFEIASHSSTGYVSGSGGLTGSLVDVEFWDGVSSLTSKPTNVQSGSRFEETDTRKIYYGALPSASAVFGKNADQVIEDFTTYANTTEGDASWITDSTTYFRVNPTTDSLDWNIITNGLRKHVYFDLGSALSDSGFVLRFKWVTTAFSGASGIDDAGLYISATTSNSNPTSQHFLGLWFDEAGSYKLIDSAGSASPEGASYDATFTHSISAETLYVEIVRLSTTSYKISFYSDSNYSNLIETQTGTLSASTTGLRYFHIFLNSAAGSSGSYYGTLNDMKLWNGVTSTDFTWTEEV